MNLIALTLVFTHLVAAGLGAAAMYVATTHYLRRREVDGHAVLELTHPELEDGMDDARRGPQWIGVVVLVASAIVISIGAQAWYANHQQRIQDRADRRYADCLTGFAADLVTTIQKRADANKAVSDAERERNDAVSDVLALVQRSQQDRTSVTQADFRRVVDRAVAARRHLTEVEQHAKAVLDKNQYVLPEAVCSR